MKMFPSSLAALGAALALSACQSVPERTGNGGYCETVQGVVLLQAHESCDGARISRVKARKSAAQQWRISATASHAVQDAEAERSVEGIPRHSAGSGFFVNGDGHVLTAAHVVAQCTIIRVQGRNLLPQRAMRVGVDPESDLAILRVAHSPDADRVPAFALTPPEDGAPLATVGYPNFRASAKMTPLHAARWTDNPEAGQLGVKGSVLAGNSGGALLTSRGTVVGLIKSRVDSGEAWQHDGLDVSDVGAAVAGSRILPFLDAHGVRYHVAGEGDARELTVSELIKRGESRAVRVDCFRQHAS